MKKLHNINEWSIIITLLLYLTFWGGIMAQVVLGLIQIGMSIFILINLKKLNNFIKILFVLYVTVTISTITLFRIIVDKQNGGFGFMFLFLIITMCLALFHLLITYKIKKL